MTWTTLAVVVTVLACLAVLGAMFRTRTYRTRGMAGVELIRGLALFSTLDVPLRQIVRDRVGKGWIRRLVGVDVGVIVTGNVELTVDLSRSRIIPSGVHSGQWVLVVPDPVPGRPFVDFEHTEFFELRHSCWIGRLWPGAKERFNAALPIVLHRFQQEMCRTVAAPGPVEQARFQFESQVARAMEPIGQRVLVRWTSKSTDDGGDDEYAAPLACSSSEVESSPAADRQFDPRSSEALAGVSA